MKCVTLMPHTLIEVKRNVRIISESLVSKRTKSFFKNDLHFSKFCAKHYMWLSSNLRQYLNVHNSHMRNYSFKTVCTFRKSENARWCSLYYFFYLVISFWTRSLRNSNSNCLYLCFSHTFTFLDDFWPLKNRKHIVLMVTSLHCMFIFLFLPTNLVPVRR